MLTVALSAVAIALAKNVLPVPGGPQKIMPLGTISSIDFTWSALSLPSFIRSRSRISVWIFSLTLV